jgi:hypothetical protein
MIVIKQKAILKSLKKKVSRFFKTNHFSKIEQTHKDPLCIVFFFKKKTGNIIETKKLGIRIHLPYLFGYG